MSTPSSLPPRCWAEIDLAALERNLRRIRAALPAHMRYVAVVKADAYGHGLPQIAARLMHAGADLFAVANLAEAAALREVGPDWPILVLGALLPDEMRFAPDYDVIATVSSAEEVEQLDRAAAAARRPLDVHLKIDTGMGRLGAWHEELAPVYQALRRTAYLRLAGIFTHFSCSDDDPSFTAEQRRRFLAALQSQCPGLDPTGLLIHADNSGGLDTIEQAGPFNAVRVGLLQFGIRPVAKSLLSAVDAEPVFSFRARIGLLKTLPAGTGISYGRTHTLARHSRVAVLTAGYGDGIPRALSNRGHVLISGLRCPILGRVTMDQTIVDVTDLPAGTPRVGDEVVLIGRQQTAELPLTEFSRLADTIPWETLCSVTKRVPRLYRTSLGV
jgi:alanine racemase